MKTNMKLIFGKSMFKLFVFLCRKKGKCGRKFISKKQHHAKSHSKKGAESKKLRVEQKKIQPEDILESRGKRHEIKSKSSIFAAGDHHQTLSLLRGAEEKVDD